MIDTYDLAQKWFLFFKDDDDEDLDDVGAYNVREQTQLRGQVEWFLLKK